MRLQCLPVFLCVLTLAIVITAIAIGPADLYEKDQPKTLAYTADILTHGRWALPRDVLYQPATKPPLYNWIAAAVIWTSGSWSETAMKSPSVMGGIGVGVILFLLPMWIARRTGSKANDGCPGAGTPDPRSTSTARVNEYVAPGHPLNEPAARTAILIGALAASLWFACGIDIRHGSTMRLMYLARPDMLQAFFLTAAWAIATCVLIRFRRRSLPLPLGEGMQKAKPLHRAEGQNGLRQLEPKPTTADQALTLTLSQEERGSEAPCARCDWVGAIGFWLCIVGAILTKGPMALLALVFVPIGAILIARSWRAILSFKPLVGFVLLVVIVGSWFYFAYRTDPAHVKSVMLGAEIVNRVTNQTPEGIEKPFYFAAMWFLTKGGPVCVLGAIGACLALISWRTKHRHAERSEASGSSELQGVQTSSVDASRGQILREYAQDDGACVGVVTKSAAIWLLILLIGLSIPAGKRIDYLLPTFAPAALLAASVLVCLVRRLRLSPLLAFGMPIALACLLSYARTHTFRESKEHWSDRATTFMRDVSAKTHGEPLLVLVRGKHPLTSLLGRHQGSALTLDDLKATTWIILPTANTTATPILTSEPLPIGFETIETRPLGTLGLYRANKIDSPTLDELVTTMRSIATWSTDENPYHAPDTVWRESSRE